MAKVPVRERPSHRCGECGHTTVKWQGRCPECQAWGTLVEVAAQRALPGLRTTSVGETPSRPARGIADVVADTAPRTSTGLAEFDRVLGGGLVAGQVVLLAGEPGVGKSTLLGERRPPPGPARRHPHRPLRLGRGERRADRRPGPAHRLDRARASCSPTRPTSGRCSATSRPTTPSCSSSTASSPWRRRPSRGGPAASRRSRRSRRSSPGSPRSGGMPLLLVGQSTRENAVAGPRTMEHMVDTVLTFEGDKHTSLRLLRSVKNRYGPADEVVCFEQTDRGPARGARPVRPVPQPPRQPRARARAWRSPSTAAGRSRPRCRRWSGRTPRPAPAAASPGSTPTASRCSWPSPSAAPSSSSTATSSSPPSAVPA